MDDYGKLEEDVWQEELHQFISTSFLPKQRLYCDRAVESAGRWRVFAGPADADLAHLIDGLVQDFDLDHPPAILPDGDGHDYEDFCHRLLGEHGWTANLGIGTGDQGVDILAKKADLVVAIQCKRWSTTVGNGAVQEVHAGMSFVDADAAAVISQSGFTSSAKALASKLGIVLIHHDEIPQLYELLSSRAYR